jgi:hypothetical protein
LLQLEPALLLLLLPHVLGWAWPLLLLLWPRALL